MAKSSGAATSSEDAARLRSELRGWLKAHPAILDQLNGMVTRLKRRCVHCRGGVRCGVCDWVSVGVCRQEDGVCVWGTAHVGKSA